MPVPASLLVAIAGNTTHPENIRGTTEQQERVSELKAYQAAGHFARGSMGPKIEAATRHLEAGGRRAIIGHLEHALDALRGVSGTHVVPG